MNHVQELLLRGASDDIQPFVKSLRGRGWSTEVIVVAGDDNDFTLRVEIRLDGMRIPIESLPPASTTPHNTT